VVISRIFAETSSRIVMSLKYGDHTESRPLRNYPVASMFVLAFPSFAHVDCGPSSLSTKRFRQLGGRGLHPKVHADSFAMVKQQAH